MPRWWNWPASRRRTARVEAGRRVRLKTMFYTYVLKSLKYPKFYTGYTDNLEKRLQSHNAGKNTYTKRYIPWSLVYSESFETKEEAIRREKYFKSAAGRKWLKKHVNK